MSVTGNVGVAASAMMLRTARVIGAKLATGSKPMSLYRNTLVAWVASLPTIRV